MTYDPKKHHRRSIRLKGYDYRTAGAYFVTIVTQDRACLFGDVVQGTVQLNDAGRMVQNVWEEIPIHYPGVLVDAFVVMPNHVHGIIILVGAGPRACPGTGPTIDQPTMSKQSPFPGQPTISKQSPFPGQPTISKQSPFPGQPTISKQSPFPGQPQGVAPTGLSLPDVVHRFKTLTTKRYTDGVKLWGWTPFRGRLWQRNYYEHIIRNEQSLNRIRHYILTNPLRWYLDHENLSQSSSDDEFPF